MDPIRRTVLALSRFPGIGEKTAQRLTWWLMRADAELVDELSDAIGSLQASIVECEACGIVSSENPCKVCADPHRTGTLICVVERPQDVHAIDSAGEYRGLFHVLHGALSPLDGIGPDDLHIDSLKERVTSASELIVAIDASIEGDATALYIQKVLDHPIKMTRLARGLPVGGHLEYVDEATLTRSINERVELHFEV